MSVPARKLPRALGLAPDREGVTVVEATRANGQAAEPRFLRVAWPAEVRDGDAAARGAFLRQALAGAGIAPAPAAIVLARGATLWRRAPLPPGAGTERAALLDFQARKEFPLPLEEMHATFWADASGRHATLAAVRRTVVQEAAAFGAAAGLSVAAVVPPPVAALAAWRADARADDGAVCLLDLGTRETELTIASGDAVWLVRTANVGHAGLDAVTLADRLGSEVERTLRAMAARPEAPPVKRLVLGRRLQSLADVLGRRAGLPADCIGAAREGPATDAAEWTALGAALGCTDPRLPGLDLSVPVLGLPRSRPRRTGRTAAGVVVAAAVLAGLWLPGHFLDQREGEALARAKRAEALEKGEGSAVAKRAERLKLLRSWTDRTRWIDVVRDLAESVPDSKDAYVASLTLREGQPLRLDGRARSEKAVHEFVAALEGQETLGQVTPRDRKRNEKRPSHEWDFTIEADVVPEAAR